MWRWREREKKRNIVQQQQHFICYHQTHLILKWVMLPLLHMQIHALCTTFHSFWPSHTFWCCYDQLYVVGNKCAQLSCGDNENTWYIYIANVGVWNGKWKLQWRQTNRWFQWIGVDEEWFVQLFSCFFRNFSQFRWQNSMLTHSLKTHVLKCVISLCVVSFQFCSFPTETLSSNQYTIEVW